jgi:PPOX class probable FMN-dependent enzyme
MPFENRIEDVAGLRQLYAQAHPAVKAKAIDHVDAGARAFLARATFAVLATSGPHGGDASPRGGPPGFAAVLDDHRIALGDLAGNRRLDSFENLLANPRVGLLFVIPGMSETLRVNGRASLTTDAVVLDACAYDGTQPKVALGIDVDEVYLHCAKAFRRSGLWDPESWPDAADRPSPGEIWKGHLEMEAPAEAIEADLEVGYAVTMWQPGGDDVPAATPD